MSFNSVQKPVHFNKPPNFSLVDLNPWFWEGEGRGATRQIKTSLRALWRWTDQRLSWCCQRGRNTRRAICTFVHNVCMNLHSLVISTSYKLHYRNSPSSEVSMFITAVNERQVYSNLVIFVFRPVWPTEKSYRLFFKTNLSSTGDGNCWRFRKICIWTSKNIYRFVNLCLYIYSMYNVYEIFLRKNCTSAYFAIKDTIANSGHKVHCAVWIVKSLLLLIPKGQLSPLRHSQYRWDKFSAHSKCRVDSLRLFLQKMTKLLLNKNFTAPLETASKFVHCALANNCM
jgi:hypothetical protein